MAPSTIGMTAYNVLTISRLPLTASQLYVQVSEALGIHIEKTDFITAMRRLVDRKLLFIHQADSKERDRFSCYDQSRRRIRWRDRTGDGWGGWMIENPQGPPMPIEAVIKQQVRLEQSNRGIKRSI